MATAMVLLALVLVLGSCAVGRDTSQPPEQRLRRALLSVLDVAAFPDAPVGLEEVSPRVMGMPAEDQSFPAAAPCGTKIALPSTPADSAMALFLSQQSQAGVANVVHRLPPGAAEQFLGRLRADIRPGCRPTVMNSAVGVQTVEFRGEVPLPPLGDDRLATWTVDRSGNGVEVHLMTATVRLGANLTSVSVLSSSGPPSEAFLADLALVAVDRLARAKLV